MCSDQDEQDAAAEADRYRQDAERNPKKTRARAEEEFLPAREAWRENKDAKARRAKKRDEG